ncbi:OpgC domain-containing protein [uncultured Thiothrix sp.]|uniref:OpgC domain-containing protein n=1 Tax=uncultured Thiothrix sp. TaxID=223185 RepID=UPI0026379110|nr:OpgC domain-containing protein [uncultured Thiothrix sp.]
MKRDLSLDILRGIMLLIMASDHFGEPIFQHLYEYAGYVSAAEGFVFLSGMLVALVYSRYQTKGGVVLEQKVWQRASVIYFYHLAVLLAVFIFTVFTVISGADWKSFATEMQVEPLRALLSGIVLSYQPPMLDILPMYVLLMLCAPLALRLMLHLKAAGIALVLLGSITLWGFSHQGGWHLVLQQLPNSVMVRMGAFDYMAWQLIFVLGMVAGFLRFSHQDETTEFNKPLFFAALGLITLLFCLRHGYLKPTSFLGGQWLVEYPHIARDNMGWLRLLNFLAFVYVIAGLIKWHQSYGIFKPFHWLGRWLAFLGQHSLQVFAFHLVVLYCYIPFRWGDWALTDHQKWVWLVIFLAGLTLPAWIHVRYQAHQRQVPIRPSVPVLPAAIQLAH